MPTFEKTIFTNLGISFLNDLNSGRIKLVNAKTVYSTSDLSGMSDDDIRNMTDIDSKDITVPCDIVRLDERQTKIRSVANNENLKQGIYIRSYATYFTDDQGNQTLFGVKVNTKPQYLVAFDGVNTNSQSYGFNVGVSQTDNVQFTKLSNLAATVQDLKDSYDKSFHFIKEWNKGIWDLQNEQDGMYYVPTNNIDNITDWNNQNSIVIKFSTPKGCVLQLIDSVGNVWVIDNFSGTFSKWNRLANASDVNAGLSAANSNAQSMANSVASTALSNQSSAVQNATNTWTSISNNANSIASNSNAISNISSSLSSASSSINNLSSITNQINLDTIKTVTPVDGLDFWNLAPGIYNFTGQKLIHTPYGDNAMLYGVCFSYGNQMIYYDKNGSLWRLSPQSGTWQSVANQTDITNVQSQINATNSVTLQYRGEWSDKGMWSIVGQLDGWYYVAKNHQDTISGWNNLNSQLFKTTMPSGTMLRLYDSWGHIWYTNNFNGSFFSWKQLA